MATPDFVLDLRAKVGNDLLWLSGVTAVVLRDTAQVGPDASGGRDASAGREVLLVRRADTGAWTPVTGIIDPGEQPAVAGAREVLEEAAIVAVPEALTSVRSLPPMKYANGDLSQYLDLTFRFRYVSGEPHPADGENTDAAWFPVEDMPPMSEDMAARVASALEPGDVARFER